MLQKTQDKPYFVALGKFRNLLSVTLHNSLERAETSDLPDLGRKLVENSL
jgi:hypothetical protein